MPQHSIFNNGAYPGTPTVNNNGSTITVGNQFVLASDLSGFFTKKIRLYVPTGGGSDLPATVTVGLNASGNLSDTPLESVTMSITGDGWNEVALSGTIPMSNVQSPICVFMTASNFRFVSTGGAPTGYEGIIQSATTSLFKMPANSGSPPRSFYMEASNGTTFNANGNLYGLDLVIEGPNATPHNTVTASLNPMRVTDTSNLLSTATDDGSIASYAWTIVSGPNTSTSQLSSTSISNPVFDPTALGTYVIRCTVTDNDAATAQSSVSIDVITPQQIVVAANNQIGVRDVQRSLPSSYTFGFGPKTYLWEVLDGPGSVTLDNEDTATALFTADTTGTYHLRLTITDTLYTDSVDMGVRVLATAPDPTSHFRYDSGFWVPQKYITL